MRMTEEEFEAASLERSKHGESLEMFQKRAAELLTEKDILQKENEKLIKENAVLMGSLQRLLVFIFENDFYGIKNAGAEYFKELRKNLGL